LAGWVEGQCAVCHGWSDERVCADCRATFALAAAHRCRRCGIRLVPPLAVCGECIVAPPAFTHTVAAVDYAYPWVDLIGRFKFGAALDLAGVLAAVLARAVQAQAVHGRSPPDLVLPVPLAARRLRERGYNQSWELARRLSSSIGVHADASLLLRIRETAAQSTLLPGERELNLRNAFAVEPTRLGEVKGRVVAVVDDVMTTGATGDEVARTLLRAGAAEVHLWMLARTPKPADLP
jgi:ComF family protein